MPGQRKRYSTDLKARVALEAIFEIEKALISQYRRWTRLVVMSIVCALLLSRASLMIG